MINSMTGYGSAEGGVEGTAYSLEIKTVNNRYFKTHIKLPDRLLFLEEDVDKLLRENLHRGTTSYVMRTKNDAEATGFEIDQHVLKKYVENAGQLAHTAGLKYDIELASMLSLPGVIQPAVPDKQQAERIKKEILNATRQALNELKQMRATEGAELEADLIANCQAIEKSLRNIRKRCHIVIKEHHEKLKKRVDQLLADAKLKLDAETLAREVAVYADRCDISEEIARLDSHLQQFLQSCKNTEHPGRKLDFITQEMLREANTIASKTADMETTQSVLDIKCHIDRLKEQVQNVE